LARPLPAREPKGPARLRSSDPLRESYFELFTRSFQRVESMRKGRGLSVYRAAAAQVLQLCGERWAQATIFPAETRLLRRFLTETALPVTNREAVICGNLMRNCWSPAWMRILLELDRETFSQICSVSGVRHLRAAQAAPGGVILVHSHTLFTQLFWRWLEHEAIDPGMTLWQWTWDSSRQKFDDPKQRVAEGARELLAAGRILRGGGLVQVLADGKRGAQHLVLPFCNRLRPFQPSFAELAVMTGAAAMPVDVTTSGDGGIHIMIHAPFADDPAAGDGKTRVQRLVRQYADHLARLWREHPEDIEWFQMHRQLEYPPLKE
jgi:lauroyl/myristoyl acyltransferase